MKKEIECKLNKSEIVERIVALNEGKIKASDYHISRFEKYHGIIFNDSFEIYAKQAFFIRIKGVFRSDINKIDLYLGYNYWAYIWLTLLNGISLIAIIIGFWGHKYDCSFAFCLVIVICNPLSVIYGRIILNTHLDAIYRILN